MYKNSDIKESLSLGLPIAFALIAQLGISLTDMALITRFGEVEAAGVSLGLSLYSLVMVFCLGIVTALSPKYATEFVKENKDRSSFSELFFNGFLISILVSIFGCLILFFTSDLLLAFGYSKDIVSFAHQYNIAAIPGLIAFLLYINVRCFLNSINKPSMTTKVMWFALLVNLLLSYFLIFGFSGEGFLGVLGAGIASSIVRVLILLHLLILLVKEPTIIQLVHFDVKYFKPQKMLFIFAFTLGMPIGLRLIFSEGYLPLLSFYIAKLGDIQLVIHSVSLRIESLFAVFAIGFSGALTTFVAWAIEKKDKQEFNRKIKATSIISTIYVLVIFVSLLLGKDFLINDIFNLHSVESVNLFDSLIIYICIYLLIDTAVTLSNGILVGMSDTVYSMLSNMIGYWLITSLFILITTSSLGPSVVSIWLGLCLGSSFVFLLNLLRIYKIKKSVFDMDSVRKCNV